jgi:hypothetical protein
MQVLASMEGGAADIEDTPDHEGKDLLCSRQQAWASEMQRQSVDMARQYDALTKQVEDFERRVGRKGGPEDSLLVAKLMLEEARERHRKELAKPAGYVTDEDEDAAGRARAHGMEAGLEEVAESEDEDQPAPKQVKLEQGTDVKTAATLAAAAAAMKQEPAVPAVAATATAAPRPAAPAVKEESKNALGGGLGGLGSNWNVGGGLSLGRGGVMRGLRPSCVCWGGS